MSHVNFKEVVTSSAAYALRDSYDVAAIAAMFSGLSTSSPDHTQGDVAQAIQTMAQHQGGSNSIDLTGSDGTGTDPFDTWHLWLNC